MKYEHPHAIKYILLKLSLKYGMHTGEMEEFEML